MVEWPLPKLSWLMLLLMALAVAGETFLLSKCCRRRIVVEKLELVDMRERERAFFDRFVTLATPPAWESCPKVER